MRTNGGVVPIVQRAEDAKFTSRFIVPIDSTAKTLADLKGKTFAFGAPSSTSGSLMPRYFLLQAGIDPERDFKSVAFSGAHDATVAFVAAGRAEAGVLNASVMDKLVEAQEPERREGARARDHAALLRLQLDRAPRPRPALTKKLTDAFLKLDPANPSTRKSWTCSARRSSSRRKARTTTASRRRRARPG